MVIILVLVLNYSLVITLTLHYIECRYMHTRGKWDLEPFLCQGFPYPNGVPSLLLRVIPTSPLKKPHE